MAKTRTRKKKATSEKERTTESGKFYPLKTRNLPLGLHYIAVDWGNSGVADIIVVATHKT
ncbi:hypothetical protein [Membranihabitans maritimus]|uniref:hypothetical protein n=1 Tax=Membranihabitans maritimus TaxID=2904244 RepID=UPI001F264E19|nr:hypothetical protein [Membranihabitans maritimus]